METVIYKATQENIKKCAEIIKNGGWLRFPPKRFTDWGQMRFSVKA